MNYQNYLAKLYRPQLIQSDRSEYICMDKNEPPFSAFDCVANLINDDDIKSLRVYPDPFELYTKLAKFSNVNINQLLITQGSEQAIEFVFRTYLEENDEVVYLDPSFAMFDVFAYIQKAKVKRIEFDENMIMNFDLLINTISEKTKLFVLANPNNPTGTAFDIDELHKIAEHTQKTGTLFLLDEAYFHFYNIDSISLLDKYEHIIITRTFSKALGIAGARVGYAISNKNNIDLLRKLKPIDEINQLSNIIAKKVLDNANIILRRNIEQVRKWKDFFKFNKFHNIQYIDTEGNFILLKSEKYVIHKALFLKNKILPKMDFKQQYLKDCFRFSIMDDVTMNLIVDLIKDIK